jgi:hypothetical protein
MVAETVPSESRRDRSALTSVAGPICSPPGYDAILDRGYGEPTRAVDLNGSGAGHYPTRLTDEQMEGLETDHRRRIEDPESCCLSLLTLTGIFRRSGTNRLGAAKVLSTTYRC